MSTAKVSPSILSADFVNMERDVRALAEWGADYVHCDVMDGVYVKNLTFGMPMIAAIKKISLLPLDVHLMITEPERYVEAFADAGADIITFHPDASRDPSAALDLIKNKGVKCGIVINPNVKLEDYIHLLGKCDVLLVMSVYAGLGGQKFIPHTLQKVVELRELIDRTHSRALIEVDGGVNLETAPQLVRAGADVLVAGNAVFKAPDMIEMIHQLKNIR